jgi:hypothetical protein
VAAPPRPAAAAADLDGGAPVSRRRRPELGPTQPHEARDAVAPDPLPPGQALALETPATHA